MRKMLYPVYMKMIMNYFMACLNAFMSFVSQTRQTLKSYKLKYAHKDTAHTHRQTLTTTYILM